MEDLLQQPALPKPSGVISNFPTTHSESQALFYPTIILVTTVPGILLLVRLYTKLCMKGKIDLSDAVHFLAWPLFVAEVVCGRLCIAHGGGVHQWDLRNQDFVTFSYWAYIFEIIYGPCIFFVKTAIILQYLRTFAPRRSVNSFMWWSSYLLIGVLATYYTISTFVSIFLCIPRESTWNPLTNYKDYRCISNSAGIVITCVFNMISDVVILLLPTRAVWKLQIPRKKKLGIIFLFAIGLLACFANALVIYYICQTGRADDDNTYNMIRAGYWILAEISFGLIVSNAFFVPKFISAEGLKSRSAPSSLTRPFSSLGSKPPVTATSDDSWRGLSIGGSERRPLTRGYEEISLAKCSNGNMHIQENEVDLEGTGSIGTDHDCDSIR